MKATTGAVIGGQTLRQTQGIAYDLDFDAENRLVSVTGPNGFSASFVYDGDGRQVKSTVSGVTTTFVGAHYQIVNGTVTKYYFAGASRIAMKTGSTLTYLLGDHLGSTSLTTDATGNFVSELRYKPWGETRYSSGTTATSYRYTGQREEAGFGLYFYNARWYDSALGRFAQADSIVPGGVQGLDRYAYVNNSPLNYVDPSGHTSMCGASCEEEYEKPQYSIDDMAEKYGITFTGDKKFWTWDRKAAALLAAFKTGSALQKEMNSAAETAYQSCLENLSGPESTCSQSASVTGAEAFNATYHYGVNFVGGCSDCERLGLTVGKHTIMFRDFYGPSPNQMLKNVNLVIHELGHMFNNLNSYRVGGKSYGPAFSLTADLVKNRYGFGTQWIYQQSDTISQKEIFADMFLGWIQGGWATDSVLSQTAANARIGWLNQNMLRYIP